MSALFTDLKVYRQMLRETLGTHYNLSVRKSYRNVKIQTPRTNFLFKYF